MQFDLTISPAGHISIQTAVAESDSKTEGKSKRATDDQVARLTNAFQQGNGAGLFELAATHSDSIDKTPSPGVRYFSKIGCRFLEQVCLKREDSPAAANDDANSKGVNSTAILTDAELTSLVLNVPPMRGAEYVNRDFLLNLWLETNAWFHAELRKSKQSLSGFLEQRAPQWHQVGRVCFHLAENRRDTEYPFAFLATYAPTQTKNVKKKTRYQPLSQALQQYAGGKNKRALVKLLSPIQATTESNDFLRELVESGDIYEPLAWSPSEAYEFLKAVPLLEENGITVRLPDWWKKRPRPRVGITIGNNKQTKFSADGMLDFRMQVALGDQTLTASEIQSLLNGDDGLVEIKGQWVEVDRVRLQQALDHWKAVEQDAVDGLSFSDGMRLLAGAPMDLGDSPSDLEQQDWSFVNAGEWLGKLLRDMRTPQQLEQAKPGKALKATLRHYQSTGVNWLTFLSDLGLGACLADDMGLGKTIQVIALLLILKRKKVADPSLLVLPASLLGNWKSEIEKFAPSLSMCFVHSSLATKDEIADDGCRSQRQAFESVRCCASPPMAHSYGKTWLLDRCPGTSLCWTKHKRSRIRRLVKRKALSS